MKKSTLMAKNKDELAELLMELMEKVDAPKEPDTSEIDALRQEIEEMKSKASATPSDAKELDDLRKELMTALAVSKMAQDNVEKEQTYPVICASNTSVAFEVPEGNGDRIKSVLLNNKGDEKYLTHKQIAYLQESHPKLFSRGLVSVPDVVADNPNVIMDVQSFLDSLSIDELNDKIASIDSIVTLRSVFEFLETKRLVDKDEDGKPLVNDDDEIIIKTVPLPPKESAALTLVIERIREITGVAISMDGGE